MPGLGNRAAPPKLLPCKSEQLLRKQTLHLQKVTLSRSV
jgi:hypothetical protein